MYKVFTSRFAALSPEVVDQVAALASERAAERSTQPRWCFSKAALSMLVEVHTLSTRVGSSAPSTNVPTRSCVTIVCREYASGRSLSCVDNRTELRHAPPLRRPESLFELRRRAALGRLLAC